MRPDFEREFHCCFDLADSLIALTGESRFVGLSSTLVRPTVGGAQQSVATKALSLFIATQAWHDIQAIIG